LAYSPKPKCVTRLRAFLDAERVGIDVPSNAETVTDTGCPLRLKMGGDDFWRRIEWLLPRLAREPIGPVARHTSITQQQGSTVIGYAKPVLGAVVLAALVAVAVGLAYVTLNDGDVVVGLGRCEPTAGAIYDYPPDPDPDGETPVEAARTFLTDRLGEEVEFQAEGPMEVVLTQEDEITVARVHLLEVPRGLVVESYRSCPGLIEDVPQR
jgi:hypothetical protein